MDWLSPAVDQRSKPRRTDDRKKAPAVKAPKNKLAPQSLSTVDPFWAYKQQQIQQNMVAASFLGYYSVRFQIL
jgi:hypothetical protein